MTDLENLKAMFKKAEVNFTERKQTNPPGTDIEVETSSTCTYYEFDQDGNLKNRWLNVDE